MEKQFYVAASRSAKQVEWRGNDTHQELCFLREARAADLVIIGRKQDRKTWIIPSIQASPFSGPGVQFCLCPTRSICFRPVVSSWPE